MLNVAIVSNPLVPILLETLYNIYYQCQKLLIFSNCFSSNIWLLRLQCCTLLNVTDDYLNAFVESLASAFLLTVQFQRCRYCYYLCSIRLKILRASSFRLPKVLLSANNLIPFLVILFMAEFQPIHYIALLFKVLAIVYWFVLS